MNNISSLIKGILGSLSIVAAVAIPGNAALVSLEPSPTEIAKNGIFTVDVMFSDVDQKIDLAGFNLEVAFDNQILAFVSGDQLTNLDGLQSDGELYSADLNAAGNVNLFWVSDYTGDFSAQPDKFRLGSLVFKGIDFGIGNISFVQSEGYNGLSDPMASWIEGISYQSASVHVPEPSLISLSMFGLLSLLALGSRRRKSN